jgi:hypothetical protein
MRAGLRAQRRQLGGPLGSLAAGGRPVRPGMRRQALQQVLAQQRCLPQRLGLLAAAPAGAGPCCKRAGGVARQAGVQRACRISVVILMRRCVASYLSQ